ncbi:semialdehyde dehydrogenase [Candidatus Poribacteria bacterium]|jgi:D-apionate oxidoisomerase|nr:semialdehyde dehydrogenase [Candidatus Poribacteria bacterium]MBT5535810.1 semialdehyde dehydrogenase [Candidatus Poribacteria bacterium]MBT5710380.1 semialdehyde dehydrogenase [Candidatus Poribacteria bacterium]MBT7101369.1 semialdehyde dehydrogenase [Candidatus Poribacteria bacterium]
MKTTVALIGAAGAMGTRIRNTLAPIPEYEVLHVETPEGEARLTAAGVTPTPMSDAAPPADVVVLAVRDDLIGEAAAQVVPLLRPGAIVISLDPAAPYAGELPDRADITYFVTHPSHPPIFDIMEEESPEARRDYWGGGLARQALVSALIQGPEEHYEIGERVSRDMFGPISRSHRVTLHQMAMLEPALSETVCATCLTVIREAMEEAIRLGVPREAARDFILGHITVELAIIFDALDWEFSMGAKKAIEAAKTDLFRPDWRDIFTRERLDASVANIVRREDD